MALLNCNESYTQDVSGCVETLIFDFTTLTADTDYIVTFTYANGWVLKREVTSNIYDATISIDNNGFWNVGTGPVLVEVSKPNQPPLLLTVCDNEYSSITLNFINQTTDDTDAVIPFTCPE